MAESDAASPKRRGRPPTRKNTAAEVSKSFSLDMNKLWRTNFRALEKLIWRDFNNNPKSQTFYKYTLNLQNLFFHRHIFHFSMMILINLKIPN